MIYRLIGPLIVVAVNVPLAVWAMAKAPRNPAHRTFALLALSLAAWNLGGAGFYGGGAEEVTVRLALLGFALAPVNFLCLAINARRQTQRGDWLLLLLYIPAIAAAILMHPMSAIHSTVPSWRIGLYALSATEAEAFVGLFIGYLASAIWISWRDAVKNPERDWMYKLVQLPLVIGILAVAGVGLLRRERTPTVALWVMVMSQYAIFIMVRQQMVPLRLTFERTATMVISGIVLGFCAVLGVLLVRPLFGAVLDEEVMLVLVAGAVSLFVLYAAVLPYLQSFFKKLGQNRKQGQS